MARIERSPRARADVLTAAQYIAEQSQSIEIAKRWLDTVDEKLTLLAVYPQAGEERPDLGDKVRAFPVGSYIIFYRPTDAGIQVLRVLHGSRDIPRAFRSGDN